MASNRTVELIADRLSIRPEQAAEALNRLSSHLLQQVLRDEHVYVRGLGTFRQQGDVIGFEPAEELNAQANADFAGLEPVTIRASRPAARPGARQHRAKRRRRAQAGWALAGFAVVLAAAFLLVQEPSPFLNLLPENSSPQQTAAGEEQLPPEVITASANNDSTAVLEADGITAGADAQSDRNLAVSSQSLQLSGLRAIDPTRGGYTVVVASFRDPEVAQLEAGRIRALVQDTAVPVDVLTVWVEGLRQYRVSVGQVPSRGEALALRSRLGALPEDAWIRRIGIDS